MARIHRQRAPLAPAGAARHMRDLEKKSKNPYKVIMEQVTEKRRKLKTSLSTTPTPPQGYTFIPAGDPRITSCCKEIARADGLMVYVVSTSPRGSGMISYHVQRIGYHFPSLVVEKACTRLGVSLSQTGQMVTTNVEKPTMHRQKQRLLTSKKGINKVPDDPYKGIPQATLDTQAGAALKDLFPNIPDKDLIDIISRAFQKGTCRVGTAAELSLSRRVQLATIAHIRHVYTDYDKLLKVTTYLRARAMVERPCLDKLAQWRKDDDDDPNAMEEILREIIVLDDDDDNDEDEDEEKRSTSFNVHHNNRDDSVEIISSRAFADDLQMPAVDYINPGKMTPHNRRYSAERDGGKMALDASQQPVPYMPQIQVDPPGFKGTSVHHHRWQEALHSRRLNQATVPSVYTASLLQEEDTPHRKPLLRSQTRINLQSFDPRATNTDPIDLGRYTQLQDAAHSHSLPLRPKPSLASQATGNISGGLKDGIIELGQSFGPIQRFSHPLSDKQVNIIPYDRERESNLNFADHHRPIDPQMMPIDENRRASRVLIHERDSQDTHDLRYQHLLRQPERLLPSVEGKLRPLNHQQGAFRDIIKPTSQSGPESLVSPRQGIHTPRAINPNNNMESPATRHRRVDDLSILSTDKSRQSPRNYHQERAYLASRNPDDGRYSPRQNHGGPFYQSVSDSFPIEERSMLVHHTSVSRHSGRQGRAQSPLNYVDHAIQDSSTNYDELEWPRHHEMAQVPLVPANAVAHRQVFPSSAHESVDISHSFPALHRSPKQLPVLHGSSRPYGTLHQGGAQLKRETQSQGGVNYFNSSSDENDRQTRYVSASPSTELEYRRHQIKDEQGGFDGIPEVYLSPRKVQGDVQIYERRRTGILLRKLSDGRETMHDGREFRLTEPSFRPRECQSSQHQDSRFMNENFNERQNDVSLRETFRSNPMRLVSDHRWTEDDTRQEPASYNHSERVLHLKPVEETNARDFAGASIKANSARWGRRMSQEIIVID